MPVDIKVEVAFNAGYRTPAVDRVWTDISAYVEAQDPISITYGRSDEFATTDANRLTGLVLDNRDGRFTAGRSESPYYPNVKVGRPIRVTATLHGTTSVRFTGYVDQWPVEWPGGGDTYATATISAASRIPRLGLTAAPPEFLDDDVLDRSPTFYWPLTEPSTASAGAELTGAGPSLEEYQKPIVFGEGAKGAESPVFGVDARPAVRVPSEPNNNPVAHNGPLGRVKLPTPIVFGPGVPGAVSISAFIQPLTDNGFGDCVTLFNIADPLGILSGSCIRLMRDFVMTSYWGDGVTGYNATVTLPGDSEKGVTRHIGLTVECNGTTVTIKGWLDGAYVGATTSVNPINGYQLTHLDLRGSNGDYRVGRVALWDHAVPGHVMEDIGNAGINGYPGDTIDERMDRIATWCRVPLTEVTTPGSSITISGMETKDGLGKPLDMLRALEATEAGVLHDDRDGQLVLRSRTARHQSPVALTIDAAAQLLGGDFVPRIDRQGLANIGTAANDLGTVAVTYTDETSRDEYGDTTYNVETLALDPEEPLRLAAARVNATSQPRPRVPVATLNVLDWPDYLLPALSGLDIGSKVDVTNAPDQAPNAAAAGFFVEGYSESLAPFAWRLALNLSPGWPVADYLVLDDAEHGVLDQNVLAL